MNELRATPDRDRTSLARMGQGGPIPPQPALAVTDKMPRRPVYERYLQRKHHMPLNPPSEVEKRDAIRILREPWLDMLSVEATRILDEAGR